MVQDIYVEIAGHSQAVVQGIAALLSEYQSRGIVVAGGAAAPAGISGVRLALGAHSPVRFDWGDTELPCIYLSLEPSLSCLLEAIELGAVTILSPGTGVDGVAAMLLALQAGEPLVPPLRMLERLVLRCNAAADTARIGITRRQLEIGCAIARGRGYEDIAEQLHCGKDNVSTHMRKLSQLTGAHSRHELARCFNQPLPESIYPPVDALVKKFLGASVDKLPEARS